MQYRDPKNYPLVYEALTTANRQDLIGHGPKCLIRPPQRPIHKPHTSPNTTNRRKAAVSHVKNTSKKIKKH